MTNDDLIGRVRAEWARSQSRWAALDTAVSFDEHRARHAMMPTGPDRDELKAYLVNRTRRMRGEIAVQQVEGEHIRKTGSQLTLFAMAPGLYMHFGTTLPGEQKALAIGISMAIAVAIYAWTLHLSSKLLRDASIRDAQLGPVE